MRWLGLLLLVGCAEVTPSSFVPCVGGGDTLWVPAYVVNPITQAPLGYDDLAGYRCQP